jgi:replicative DNA helicase
LQDIMASNDGRCAILSAEGGIFDMMAGMYSGKPNLNVYLKGHAGDDIRVDRKGNAEDGTPEGSLIRNAALTVGVMVQPSVLSGLMQSRAFVGRGIPQRFLYSLPPGRVGEREVDTADVPDDVLRAYTEAVFAMGRWRPQTDTDGMVQAHSLELTDGARKAISSYELELDRRCAKGKGDLHSMSEWAGKLHGQVTRVAALLHLMEYVDHPTPWGTPISRDTMEKAIIFGAYAVEHARAAHQEMGSDPGEERAKKILDWVVGRGLRSFSRRDCQAGIWDCRKMPELEEALKVLVDRGYVRLKRVQGKTNRAKEVYEVNPAAFVADTVAATGEPYYSPVAEGGGLEEDVIPYQGLLPAHDPEPAADDETGIGDDDTVLCQDTDGNWMYGKREEVISEEVDWIDKPGW